MKALTYTNARRLDVKKRSKQLLLVQEQEAVASYSGYQCNSHFDSEAVTRPVCAHSPAFIHSDIDSSHC
jgi:hypothetical protein